MPAKDLKDGTKVPLYEERFDEEHRRDFEKLWERLSDLEKHEDTLFNSRIQSFLVVTSFLLGGLSQFRERPYFLIQVLFSLFGMAFSFGAYYVLRRTASTIEWYLEALIRLDKILYLEDMQPYRTRRVKTLKRSSTNAEVTLGPPVSAMLGVVVPAAAAAIWFLLLLWSFSVHHFLHPSSENEVPGRSMQQQGTSVQPPEVIIIQKDTDTGPTESAQPAEDRVKHDKAPKQPCAHTVTRPRP